MINVGRVPCFVSFQVEIALKRLHRWHQVNKLSRQKSSDSTFGTIVNSWRRKWLSTARNVNYVRLCLRWIVC